MAGTLHLIDKVIKLHCPICGTDYPFNLVNIMGFSFDDTTPTQVAGLVGLPAQSGETMSAAIAFAHPRKKIDVFDVPASAPHQYDPATQEKRAKIEEKMEKELAEPHTYLFTCPKDQKQLQVTLALDNGDVKATDTEAATPGNAALYTTGAQIQANSLSVASGFCTSMVGVSSGSVAVYTGLLALVIPKSSSILWPGDLWSVIPAVGFIVAAIIFALGAFPQIGYMRLSFPASIESFRDAALAWRAKWSFIAFLILCASFLAAFIFIAWIAGTPAIISPTPSPTATPTLTPTP